MEGFPFVIVDVLANEILTKQKTFRIMHGRGRRAE